MTQTYKNKKHTAASVVALTVIGVVSSGVFVLTAVAASLVPHDVIALANASRTSLGMMPLTENVRLREAAKNKADDMIKNDYFAHTSPKGVEPWYWIKQADYQYRAAGENLAINYTDATEQHEAWMNSATHRANILNLRYQEIGVAVAQGKIGGKESTVTVEFFGSPVAGGVDRAAQVPPAVPVAFEVERTVMLQTDFLAIAWMLLFLFSIFAAPSVLVFSAYQSLRYGKKPTLVPAGEASLKRVFLSLRLIFTKP